VDGTIITNGGKDGIRCTISSDQHLDQTKNHASFGIRSAMSELQFRSSRSGGSWQLSSGLDTAFCRKEPASFWAASCRVLRPIRTGSVEVATKTCLAREVLRA